MRVLKVCRAAVERALIGYGSALQKPDEPVVSFKEKNQGRECSTTLTGNRNALRLRSGSHRIGDLRVATRVRRCNKEGVGAWCE